VLNRSAGFVVAVMLGTCALAHAESPAPEAPSAAAAALPQLEVKAIDLLKATSARLAAARTMSFTAVVSYESPSVFGPALVYTTRSDVVLQRPDKLRVITPGDGPATEFYYDGKTMTAFSPVAKLVATAAAPTTIDATLAAAFNDAAIYFPFTDLIVADPYKDLEEGLQIAFYIGRSSEVGGTTTDMVAFANAGVFAQIWIGVEDGLPRRLRAEYLNDPSHLRHDMVLSNWKLNPKLQGSAFSASKADSATRIAFARPDATAANPGTPPPMTPPGAPASMNAQ
jgi:hypothetical protein